MKSEIDYDLVLEENVKTGGNRLSIIVRKYIADRYNIVDGTPVKAYIQILEKPESVK